MIALKEILEDFGLPAPGSHLSLVSDIDEAQLESEKLEAFENGYRAGWDDAVKAQTEDTERLSSAFSQNLQDLSFTYHEAHGQIMNAMAPLLEEMVSVLLPKLAREALAPHILTEILAIARDSGSPEVIVAVSPADAATVAPLVEADYGFPITVQQDDTLAEGQADIRFGKTEKQIDLSAALEGLSESVRGFIHDNQRITAHG